MSWALCAPSGFEPRSAIAAPGLPTARDGTRNRPGDGITDSEALHILASAGAAAGSQRADLPPGRSHGCCAAGRAGEVGGVAQAARSQRVLHSRKAGMRPMNAQQNDFLKATVRLPRRRNASTEGRPAWRRRRRRSKAPGRERVGAEGGEPFRHQGFGIRRRAIHRAARSELRSPYGSARNRRTPLFSSPASPAKIPAMHPLSPLSLVERGRSFRPTRSSVRAAAGIASRSRDALPVPSE